MRDCAPGNIVVQLVRRALQFVNDDLEPEFVGLVDNDKEEFVRSVVREWNL